jgi:hypothetical protein
MNSKTVAMDNLFTSTWQDVRKGVIDQVFGITPFYDKMVEGGRIKGKAADGTHWEIPISYAKQDSNRKWFGENSTFGKAQKESLTSLIYSIKYCGTSIVRKYITEQKNRGPAKIFDYVKEMMDNTKMSLIDGFETDMLVQNADALSMTALPTLLPNDNTSGSVGGMTRTANDFLQHNAIDFGASTDTTVGLIPAMKTMLNKCSLWKSGVRRAPDLILTTREIYQDIETIAENMQSIVTNESKRVSLGFGDLMYKNTEIFWAPGLASGSMYFLNTENIELRYDPANWFTMTDWKQAQDNLDRVAQILCACEMILTNARKHGVIYNITAKST